MAACIEQENHHHQQQQQHPVFKHYCRVCKKGFMCGRALGGHMRAHGIGDESGNLDDDDDEDDPVSDWEDKGTSNNKRMYKLRTNPNRLKSVRVCENCGQEFFSWKSFLEHGKCGSGDDDMEDEEEESLVSSPGSDADESFGARRGHGWSKRKRSLRAKVESNSFLSSEDEDLLFAKCLVDLANERVYSPPHTAAPEPEESSCASASKEFLAPRVIGSASANKAANNNNKTANNNNISKGLFECKACKKVFTSHQALGGHRASHKKVKGCYAAKQDLDNNNNNDVSLADDDVITHEEFMPNSKSSSYQFEPASSRRKSKVHECSICHRVFTTGQALGGHKRCHWITSNTTYSPAAVTKISDAGAGAALDLNLPAAHGGGDMSRLRNPSLNFEVSTEIQLHRPWYNDDNINNNVSKKQKNDVVVEDDEADSKLKFARISGLKETSTSKGGNSSSQWLQVGIGSAQAEIGPD